MIFQLCQKHYKDNLKRSLDTLSNPTHLSFMQEIYFLFKVKRNEDDFNRVAKNIMRKYLTNDLLTSLMVDIDRRKPELLGYLKSSQGVVRVNNLIECYNSHIQGRLETIKGFKSFNHANYWLNAYFLRRRTKKFTDCSYKFKHLNGNTSLNISSGNREKLPKLFV